MHTHTHTHTIPSSFDAHVFKTQTITRSLHRISFFLSSTPPQTLTHTPPTTQPEHTHTQPHRATLTTAHTPTPPHTCTQAHTPTHTITSFTSMKYLDIFGCERSG